MKVNNLLTSPGMYIIIGSMITENLFCSCGTPLTNGSKVCSGCLEKILTKPQETFPFQGKYKQTYSEYLASEEPMKLQKEMARMRTIIEMFFDCTNEIGNVKGKDLSDPATHDWYMKKLRETISLIEKVSEVAKRWKEIEEGITLKVEINVNALTRFIYDVVFVHVKDTETRRKIMESARDFKMASPNALALMASKDHMVEGFQGEN